MSPFAKLAITWPFVTSPVGYIAKTITSSVPLTPLLSILQLFFSSLLIALMHDEYQFFYANSLHHNYTQFSTETVMTG